MVKWIGLVLMTPKTCNNHGQRETDRQTDIQTVIGRRLDSERDEERLYGCTGRGS